MKDLKEVIWNSNGDKSPGLGGFGFKFYKAYWGYIKEDLFDCASEIFNNGHMPEAIASSFLDLIPKK